MPDTVNKLPNSFIQCLWGVFPTDQGYKDNRFYHRRKKMINDMTLSHMNYYSPRTKVYVFGRDNFNYTIDQGFNAVMIDKRPFVFDMDKEQYAHKLLVWQYALQEFKSIVYTDFDTITIKPVPLDFWDVMDKGQPIRSTIYQYSKKRAPYRKGHERKISSASWVYMRGKEHADNLLKTWIDIGRPMKEEYALSRYIDKLNPLPFSPEAYKPFDCPYYQLQKIDGLPKNKEDMVWKHFNHYGVSHLLGDGTGIKNRIDQDVILNKEYL